MRSQEKQPIFSIIMCTYNDDSLLYKAISSVTAQSFQSWELIVLDNSNKTDRIWNKLSELSEKDNRIRCFRSNENIGWAKGAAFCLGKAAGKYMTFLAADDYIAENAFEKLDQIIEKDNPDIIWVGMAFVKYEGENMTVIGRSLPENKVFDKTNRSETIYELMKNGDYNTFYHYEKIEFLRTNHIDFFEPYYADCTGMTKAMSVADSMVSIDDVIYILSTDTSQTRGHYVWDSYKIVFGLQWESIADVFQQEHFSQKAKIQYAATRIANNQLSSLNALCENRCRNNLMNPIDKRLQEVFIQLKNVLEYMPVIEMMHYCGREDYLIRIKNMMIRFCNSIGMMQFSNLDQNWLWRLFNVCLEVKDGFFVEVTDLLETDMDYLLDVVLDEENTGAIGFELIAENIINYDDETFMKYHEKLSKAMSKYNMLNQRNENLFQ